MMRSVINSKARGLLRHGKAPKKGSIWSRVGGTGNGLLCLQIFTEPHGEDEGGRRSWSHRQPWNIMYTYILFIWLEVNSWQPPWQQRGRHIRIEWGWSPVASWAHSGVMNEKVPRASLGTKETESRILRRQIPVLPLALAPSRLHLP